MMEQRTPEWYAARLGKVTASRVADITSKTKSGYSTSRANYMAELLCERLTGTKADGYVNAAMQWGIDIEPSAREAYQSLLGVLVEETGFVNHPDITMAGASPDGLIGDVGMVEIKCPTTSVHIDTLMSGVVPSKHMAQIQWQMACTGRNWCDFVSYDPRMPENMRMFVQRVDRDETYIEETTKEVNLFLSELDTKISTLNQTYGDK
jgi:putative phage-type endonuclease